MSDDAIPSPKFGVVQFDAKKHQKDEVIQAAKRLLSMEEEGEITDLAYAATERSGFVQSGITSTDNALLRIAAVSIMLRRLHDGVINGGCRHE